MKINRNDSCWCGSGKKYKKCHYEFDEKYEHMRRNFEEMPGRDLVKNEEQIEGIRISAEVNNGVLDLIEKEIKAGMSTAEIDKLVYDYTVAHDAIPAPLNYEGFPKSVCTSINDEVCHGIPSEDIILKEGDIINVDVSTIKNGYYSDASRMFTIGKVSDEAQKLVDVTKEALKAGIEAVKPWGHLGDIGAAIKKIADANGYSIVRDFGGHGVGIHFHEEPFVPHIGEEGEGVVLVPGMVFTIEPMLNTGKYHVTIDEDNGWVARTADGSLSAQAEHTILVTEDGIEIIAY
ncbi:methionyl aminopeptidase [Clostridium mediterraneense]|uniref:methionyl aminopeptidase n=1 Tax=Clostridium mediterraneense TaxID=1805472 RepID=UPI000831F95C|nr:methionyl aminopeptidase [Clostridium mediterraneense]